jgi:S-adenosylmethionine hydrolase
MIVTFTTDFGTSDGYAGAMKGVVLSLAPDAVLVDISHDVPARDVQAGAFTLAQAARCFPPGTIHVAVVDPGVGGRRAEVLVAAAGAFFVGPDNGLLSLAAVGPRRAWRIENAGFRREPVSDTFHGRDVFAPAAGRLASGWAPDGAGRALDDLAALPVRDDGVLREGGAAEVIHIDAFGNLFTSFRAERPLTGFWELELQGRTFAVTGGRTFVDAPLGELVVYPGSGGQVEIAVRDGSAAALTGARRGTALHLRRRP